MKKILILLVFVLSTAQAQQHAADDIFDQYAGKDGFTTVNITTSILQLIDSVDGKNSDFEGFTGIKILAVDDENTNKNIDFSRDIIKKLKRDQYKELMTVKEKDQEVLMLIKQNGKTISEFLMVVGGKDNALISIRGAFTMANLRKLANNMDIDGLEHINHLDKQKS